MLENLKTVELRKLAGQMGIKGMSSARKEQIIPVITAKVEADYTEALAEFATRTAATAKPKGNRCSICGIRPVGGKGTGDREHAKTMGYCTPCLTEAEMDNAHSDYAHEERANAEEGTASYPTDAERAEMDTCWVCHPELNEANAEYVAPKGVARKGQKLHVSLRASGETKANETIAQLPEGANATVSVAKSGTTVLTVVVSSGDVTKVLTLVWDAAGRYSYPQSTVSTKGGKASKVRNVSEALRIANA